MMFMLQYLSSINQNHIFLLYDEMLLRAKANPLAASGERARV